MAGLESRRLLAGRYRIERRLGEGAAGKVWLARDMRLRGLVWAIKELDFNHLPPGERAEALALFNREADMLMCLRHPSLPRVVERFSQDGREYLVMERVEGPTLESILESRGEPLEEPQVSRWGVEICQALEYLHGRVPPVIYRDLKPSNVMVPQAGPVKLVDFGIARPLNPARPKDTVAYGTPGYAPPEQYQGRACPQSDLYALGVVLFQMLTCQEPRQFGFIFPPVRRLNPEVSQEMEELLSGCLELDPARRPASAELVRQRLEPLATRVIPWWRRRLARLEQRLERLARRPLRRKPR
ncbi:MAG TPA: serine/threonine-protein kinase [Candidatus Nitrosotenuis sp.]|nr:serine/threonine-protein kinase [Candidatus Nitrosotenuis sp.]